MAFNGRFDTFLSRRERLALNLAEVIWPIISFAALTVPGLVYSYAMSPKSTAPKRPNSSLLIKMAKGAKNTVLLAWNTLMSPRTWGQKFAAACRGALLWFGPQHVMHQYIGQGYEHFMQDSFSARAKALMRPILEGLIDVWDKHSGDRSFSIYGLIPDEPLNPGYFSKAFSLVVGTPVKVLRNLLYDIPKNLGLLGIFGINKKTSAETAAEGWYEMGQTFAPLAKQTANLLFNTASLFKQGAGLFVNASLWPFKTFYSVATQLSEQGLSEVTNEKLNELHELLNDNAYHLSAKTGGWISQDTALKGEYVVGTILAGASAYALVKHRGNIVQFVQNHMMPLVFAPTPPTVVVHAGGTTHVSQVSGGTGHHVVQGAPTPRIITP